MAAPYQRRPANYDFALYTNVALADLEIVTLCWFVSALAGPLFVSADQVRRAAGSAQPWLLCALLYAERGRLFSERSPMRIAYLPSC